MKKNVRSLTTAAVLAALYIVLVELQNLLLPGTASLAVQFRIAEALCVFAIFTPAAIYGLSLGCLVCNLLNVGALPLDFIVGTVATTLATLCMRLLRGVRIRSFPLLSLLMPVLLNGIFVGWELTIYFGELSFWLNAVYVAVGEAAVVFTLGTALYFALRSDRLRLLRR